MSEILLVDDDAGVRELLEMYLAPEGFQLQAADSGEQALEFIHTHQPALILLDVVMPGMDGYEVCRVVRTSWNLPVIFLTCKDDDLDPIIGLEIGADDYITKPFNPREVVARIKAVLRRAQATSPGQGKRLTTPCMQIYQDTREVRVCSQLVSLTRKEFNILWLLVSHSRVVYSREQIMQQVWGYGGRYSDTRTVETHVKRLRKKIMEAGCRRCTIEAVRGSGYRFIVDPARDSTVD